MLECKIDGVDIFNPIKDRMPEIIEYFVKFYGEKYRKTITERLTCAKYIFVGREGLINFPLIRQDRELCDALRRIEGKFVDYKDLRDEELLHYCKERVEKLGIKLEKAIDYDCIGVFRDFVSNKKFTTTGDERRYRQVFSEYFGVGAINYYGVLHNDTIEKFFDKELRAKFNEDEEKYQLLKIVNNPYYRLAEAEIRSFAEEKNLYNVNELMANIYNLIIQADNTCAFVECEAYLNKIVPICVCPNALDCENLLLVHELDHIVNFCQIFGETSKTLAGKGEFETLKFDKNFIDYNLQRVKVYSDKFANDTSFSKYELLGEIINDYFAVKINDMMKRDGVCFTLNKRDFVSSYSKAFPLVEDFIEEHMEELKEHKMSEDPDYFAKVIGQENFDKLAETVNSFFDAYSQKTFSIMCGKAKCTNLKKIVKCDCEWTGNERKIVEAFKSIEEVRQNINNAQKSVNSTKLEAEVE